MVAGVTPGLTLCFDTVCIILAVIIKPEFKVFSHGLAYMLVVPDIIVVQ